MIHVRDSYFQEDVFNSLVEYCKNDFKIIKLGEKEFSVLETPEQLLPAFELKGHRLILSFIRSAHKDFDTELRIHADNIINGQKTSVASVLYISGNEVSQNGTAFYNHIKYGKELPKSISNEEFDYLIENDSKDYSKWKKTSIIVGEPNRMLTYSSNLFHGKFPSKIDKGIRKVLVNFYTKI